MSTAVQGLTELFAATVPAPVSAPEPIEVTGPSAFPWTTSWPYRIELNGRFYYEPTLGCAEYFARRNFVKTIELSARFALGPATPLKADEPWTEPTPGQVAAAEGAY